MAWMDRVRRAVAAVTFCSILVCSGLGFCWKQFAPKAHDCCEDGAVAPAKACASVGAQTTAISLAPPMETALPDSHFATVAFEPVAAPSAEVRPGTSPPLVLRV